MQVANPNNIKIYNLSAGKSLPEWLSDKKRRSLLRSDGELRRRIELIQDFEMPHISSYVEVTPDKQYIYVSGVYKPRLRCYEVNNLSMKFERCFDSDAVKFHVLSDDYSKLVIMQNDRYIEFHSQQGKWYRTRIPRYGRDMDYHRSSCDMYFVGCSSEIYRLNLERGSFMQSLKTKAEEIYCCQFNPHHELFTCGTIEGHVECWDPRAKSRAGVLDCATHVMNSDLEVDGIAGITALKYKDALTFGVGTSTGQVALYDIRSSKPLLVKDHNYGLPIKGIRFHTQSNLVLSIDSRILKIWEEDTGKPFTSIEPETKINSLSLFPESGLVFLANEAPKVLTYYLPALGSAPRWCSFLDSLTEELEENPEVSVYDDYKFVTRQELEGLGMSNMIGTNLLRAYMHGYFMDVRLYHKAKSIVEPFAYKDYRKAKIREKIEKERENRVQIKKLPKVNTEFAEKLMLQSEDQTLKKKKKIEAKSVLQDDRFSAMFERKEFQVDQESEEFRLLNPTTSQLAMSLKKKYKKAKEGEDADGSENSAEEDSDGTEDESSSDDEHGWSKKAQKAYREVQRERRAKDRRELLESRSRSEPRFRALDSSAGSRETETAEQRRKRKLKTRTLGDRVEAERDSSGIIRQSGSAAGSMELTFQLKKYRKNDKREQQNSEHYRERKALRRSAGSLKTSKPRSNFFMK